MFRRVANVQVRTHGQTPQVAARKLMEMIDQRIVHVTGSTIEPYDVCIGEGVMSQLAQVLGDKPAKVALIHTQAVQRHSDRARTLLRQSGYDVHDIVIPDAEAGKTIEVANGIWQRLGRKASPVLMRLSVSAVAQPPIWPVSWPPHGCVASATSTARPRCWPWSTPPPAAKPASTLHKARTSSARSIRRPACSRHGSTCLVAERHLHRRSGRSGEIRFHHGSGDSAHA